MNVTEVKRGGLTFWPPYTYAKPNCYQELIRRWDSERELFLQHRTCRGQRLRPL